VKRPVQRRDRPDPPDAVVYTSAFWSSSCCMAPLVRVCHEGEKTDRLTCRKCGKPCLAVRDER
jgi:hypothetical protein